VIEGQASIHPLFRDPNQASLDEYRAGVLQRARDTGIEAAERADAEWADAALDWLEQLPPGAIVSGDDLRRELGTSAAAGAVFLRAAKLGLIAKFDITTSTAPTRHGALTRRWVRRGAEGEP
jgi:hypothetical protein